MTDRLAALSAEERRALLMDVLRREAMQPRRAPVSAAQERLWFLHQLAPETPLYNIPVALRIIGPFDPKVAQRALDEVVRRHETLRTTFETEDGRPVQTIVPTLALSLDVVDLGGRPALEREEEARRLIVADARRPFDLTRGPLLRVGVARLDDEDHVLFSTMHHLIVDGWSLRVFCDEMVTLYRAFVRGEPSPLPEPSVQYADFVAWQRQRLESSEHRAGLTAWVHTLAGPLPVVELPTDRPRPAVKSHRGAIHRFTLSPRTSAEIKALSRREGVTPFMVLVAAFSALLFRYTGERDLLIGTPVAGRKRPELEGLIGCFVNTVVLRMDLGGDPSFRALLGRSRQVALDAYAHDDVPFEQLVQKLRPDRDPGHTPVFQVMFVLHRPPVLTPAMHELEIHTGTAKFDLSLEVVEGDDHFWGWFEFDTDLFDPETIARTAGHFETLLEGVLRAPGRPVSQAPLLTGAEWEERRRWNDTRLEWPRAAGVHALIEAQVARAPDAVAVVFEDAGLTYGALNARANGLARRLRRLGVRPDVPVGVYMERSLELVVAVLAILKAGGVYLPLDPTDPPERLTVVLREAGAPVVLTGLTPSAWLASHAAHVIAVDANAGSAVEDTGDLPGLAEAEQLAYIIYTSGSTGAPKGAMVAHGALGNRLLWMQRAYPLTAADRVLHKTPIGFDVSLWELLWPLLAGATLVVARPDGHRHGPYLAGLIAERAITVTHFVPTMLRVFLAQPGLEARCRSLRHVVCSGEPLTPDLVRRFVGRLDAALHNLYGPTEAGIDVTASTCRREDPGGAVSIGRPIANTQIHLLDAAHHPAPVGHPGELYIGGAALARGYLGRPGLTAERFLPDPFGEPSARVYRTGDLARCDTDGRIEFVGRADRQVKIRGCRIEPGEVEAALAAHPRVREAVVDARPDAAGEARLVAYVVVSAEPRPTPAELRAHLKQRLPEYMVPSAFVTLRELPLTTSGKVDHRALPEPSPSSAGDAGAPPRTPTERRLAAIWSDVLGMDAVGIDDNFFDLGGASIQCMRVVTQANEAGLSLTPEMLFEHQTIAELAAALPNR